MSQRALDLPTPAPQMGNPRDFLMLVKTYPVPSTKYGETVCCAAIDTTTGRWVRIYPVNFRALAKGERFRKWQFIRAAFGPARDDRPESIRVFQETNRRRSTSIIASGLVVAASRTRSSLTPSRRSSSRSARTARRWASFVREPSTAWSSRPRTRGTRRATASYASFELSFAEEQEPVTDLKRIPFRFKYRFHCDETTHA